MAGLLSRVSLSPPWAVMCMALLSGPLLARTPATAADDFAYEPYEAAEVHAGRVIDQPRSENPDTFEDELSSGVGAGFHIRSHAGSSTKSPAPLPKISDAEWRRFLELTRKRLQQKHAPQISELRRQVKEIKRSNPEEVERQRGGFEEYQVKQDSKTMDYLKSLGVPTAIIGAAIMAIGKLIASVWGDM